MRLTPLDIRKQEFKKGMRGLDAEEVYAFLSTVADEYEALINEHKSISERLIELENKIVEYRNMERTLRDTLMTAERITGEAQENARRKANLIIKEAELEAEKGVRDIKANAVKLRDELKSLKRQRDSYLARMRSLVESHLQYISTAEEDFIDDDRTLKAETDRTKRREDSLMSRAIKEGTDSYLKSKSDTQTKTSAPQSEPPPQFKSTTPPVKTGPVDPQHPEASVDAYDWGSDSTRAPQATSNAPGHQSTGAAPAPDLNAILDRMIESRQETLKNNAQSRPSSPVDVQSRPAAAETSVQTAEPPIHQTPLPEIDMPYDDSTATDEVEHSSKPEWSLERLKKDLLAKKTNFDDRD